MTRSRSTPSPKLQLFAAFAGVARALGNPHRLDLLEHLAQGEKPVETLAAKADLSFANASQHLQALRRAGGNQTKAAALLGLNRDQIRYRIEKFGLTATP